MFRMTPAESKAVAAVVTAMESAAASTDNDSPVGAMFARDAKLLQARFEGMNK